MHFTEGTAEMKKCTSGASGHMFSLFRLLEKKNRTKFEKGKTALLFLGVVLLAALMQFLTTWPSYSTVTRPVSFRAREELV